MKKCCNFKRVLSIMLLCAMFLPGVSAYYSSMELAGNNSSSTLRSPIYRGSCIDISFCEKRSYSFRYASFLTKHPSRYSEVCESGGRTLKDVYEEEIFYLLKTLTICHGRTLKDVYEEEIRHVGAASYVTALYLGCADDVALRFSADITKLCNLITGYPQTFNKSLLVFVANYAYSLLGEVFKKGALSDLNATALYGKFSNAAYMSSSMYCAFVKDAIADPIPNGMFEECMAIPQQ